MNDFSFILRVKDRVPYALVKKISDVDFEKVTPLSVKVDKGMKVILMTSFIPCLSMVDRIFVSSKEESSTVVMEFEKLDRIPKSVFPIKNFNVEELMIKPMAFPSKKVQKYLDKQQIKTGWKKR